MSLPPFVTLLTWLLLSAPFVYLIGRIDAAAKVRRGLARWLALLCLAGAWFAFGNAAVDYFGPSPSNVWTIGAVSLRFDGLSLLISGLVLLLTTLVTFYSGPTIAGANGTEKYYVLLILLCSSIIGISSAADLFLLWLWFEAMAICAYPLVVYHSDDRLSLEAGAKYLVQSAAGSSLILVGVALVLLAAGTLDISAIAATLGNMTADPAVGATPIWLVAGLLFVIGFGIKVAIVPLHTWLPDAHSQAPSGISAMLSAIVIEAGLVALLRSLSGLAAAATTWGLILMAAGAVNMLAGNLLALRQTQVKRLLAFSSISHVGYMIAGFGLALYVGTAAGAQAGMFHLLSHGLMKGLAFMAAGAFLYVLQQQAMNGGQGSHALEIADLGGAAARYPALALCFSLALLALGGMPPLAGFMSKWQILMAGAQTGDLAILLLMLFIGVNSVLSLAYYAPIVNRMYRNEPTAAVGSGGALSLKVLAPVALLALLIVVIGLWPSLVSDLTGAAARDLMAAFGR